MATAMGLGGALGGVMNVVMGSAFDVSLLMAIGAVEMIFGIGLTLIAEAGWMD